jgi:hypothetical protein
MNKYVMCFCITFMGAGSLLHFLVLLFLKGKNVDVM